MHQELWKQLGERKHQEIAHRAGCAYDEATQSYAIEFLNRRYRVAPGPGEIYVAGEQSGEQPAGYLEQLCVLAYLLHCKSIPPADEMVRGESLALGEFYFRGHHRLPHQELADLFGDDPRQLHEAARSLAAAPRDYGDASVQITLLPRLPVVFVLWGSDEEFEARASIFFDRTAAEQMPLDALQIAVNLAVKALGRAQISPAGPVRKGGRGCCCSEGRS